MMFTQLKITDDGTKDGEINEGEEGVDGQNCRMKFAKK